MIDTNWLSNLKKFDRERFDSLKHLNSENRKELAAIYAFNLELANIAWNTTEADIGYLKLRWWENCINDMNKENSFGDNECLLILSKLVAEEKLDKSNLLRLIRAREFDCSKKPFDNHEQQISYLRDTSQNLLFMGLSCLKEFNDYSLRKNLSEYFGLSLGFARFILAVGSLRQNKCYSLFLPAHSDYSAYFECKLSDHIIERIRYDIDLIFNLIKMGDKELQNMGLKKKSLFVLNTVRTCLPILKEIKNSPQLIFRRKHKLSFKYKFIGKINELVT
ncbi:squalene/phytoene synthase family protein [Paracoccaceae bacterium]|nr:squalene/phytoene synthase family protein [Paracoccaceae bacterium]